MALQIAIFFTCLPFEFVGLFGEDPYVDPQEERGNEQHGFQLLILELVLDGLDGSRPQAHSLSLAWKEVAVMPLS